MRINREEIDHKFNTLVGDDRDSVINLHAWFYYRTGSHKADGSLKHTDGSAGDINITPKELRDALAYAFLLGKES